MWFAQLLCRSGVLQTFIGGLWNSKMKLLSRFSIEISRHLNIALLMVQGRLQEVSRPMQTIRYLHLYFMIRWSSRVLSIMRRCSSNAMVNLVWLFSLFSLSLADMRGAACVTLSYVALARIHGFDSDETVGYVVRGYQRGGVTSSSLTALFCEVVSRVYQPFIVTNLVLLCDARSGIGMFLCDALGDGSDEKIRGTWSVIANSVYIYISSLMHLHFMDSAYVVLTCTDSPTYCLVSLSIA